MAEKCRPGGEEKESGSYQCKREEKVTKGSSDPKKEKLTSHLSPVKTIWDLRKYTARFPLII